MNHAAGVGAKMLSKRAQKILTSARKSCADGSLLGYIQPLKDEYILNDMRLQALKAKSTMRRFWSCMQIIMSEENENSGEAHLSTSVILQMRQVSKEMKDCVSKFWLNPRIVLTPRGLQKATTHFFASFRTLLIEHIQEDILKERYWLKSILKIHDLQERNFHLKLRISSHVELDDLAKLFDKNSKCLVTSTSSPGLSTIKRMNCLSIMFCGDNTMSLIGFRKLSEHVRNLEIEIEGNSSNHSCNPSNLFLENLSSVRSLAMLGTIRVLDLSDNGTLCGPDAALEFRNMLTSLSQLHTLKLSSVNIQHSDLTELSSSISSIFGLTELVLDGYHRGHPCGFDSLGAFTLASALARITTIHSLDIEGNPVGDVGLLALVSAIVAPRSLMLDTARVSAAGVRALSDILRSKLGLTELSLNHSEVADGTGSFGDAGATELAAAIVHLTALMRLTLSGNAMGDAGATAVGSALTAHTRIKLLSLQEDNIGVAGIKAFSHVLALSGLETLDLSCNDMGNAGAVALATVLSGRKLTELDISHNGITDLCASPLFQKLACFTSLNTLNLGGNDFGTAGVHLLAKRLPILGALKSLSLYSILLDDCGLARLAPALAWLTALQELDLCYNSLGPVAPALILGFASSQPPPRLRHLKFLGLGCNAIRSAGATALASSLVGRTALRTLDVCRNRIGDSGAAALAPALAALGSLSKAVITDNEVGEAGRERLREALVHVRDLSV
jgi:Ran GTPase-activating protein (RanGAP) involved in mRNA processing and transport